MAINMAEQTRDWLYKTIHEQHYEIKALKHRITDFKNGILKLQEEDGRETGLWENLENMMIDDKASEEDGKK